MCWTLKTDLIWKGLPHLEILWFKSSILIFKLISKWHCGSSALKCLSPVSAARLRPVRLLCVWGNPQLPPVSARPMKSCVSPQPEHFNRCDCLCGLFYTVWRGKSNNSAHWLSWRSLLAALQRWCHRRPINTESCVTCCFHGAEVTHEEVWKADQSASWDPDSRDSFTYFMREAKLNLCPKLLQLVHESEAELCKKHFT